VSIAVRPLMLLIPVLYVNQEMVWRLGAVSGVGQAAYFNCVEIDVNLVFSFGPMPYTTAMIASAMPLAMMLYSIAVVPDSSARKRQTILTMRASF